MSEEFEVEAIGIEVSTQPIELYKVLKIANAVSGGGEAKMAISEGYVAVNGDVETRKRCKVYDGDVIQFNGEFYLVLCDAPIEDTTSKTMSKEKPNQQKSPAKNTNKRQPANQVSDTKSNKRTNSKAGSKAGSKAKAGQQRPPKDAPSTQHDNPRIDNPRIDNPRIDKQTGRREIKF